VRANRAFRRAHDDAVSPVISVILLVAITAVLSTSVYVWASGFNDRGAKNSGTLSLTSNGNVDVPTGHNPQKDFVIVTQSPGLAWNQITWRIGDGGGTYLDTILTGATADDASYCILDDSGMCYATPTDAGTVDAGDRIIFEDTALSGAKIVAVSAEANSVMMQLTVT
jgi:hypothetical protein